MLRVEGGENLPALRPVLERVRSALADTRALYRDIADGLSAWVDRNFDASGRLHRDFPSGWPVLAPATLAARRRRGQGTRPLEATGRLRGSIRVRVGAEGLLLDSSAPYAAVHQLGLGVPRRSFFPDAQQLERIVLPIAVARVERELP